MAEAIYKINAKEAKEIRERMRTVTQAASYRRLKALALLGEGKTSREVARITQYNEQHVRVLGRRYHAEGIEALARDRRTGGKYRIMSPERSEAFLKHFERLAQSGQVITINEIAKMLDEETGKKRASHSTAYSFLHRHGWYLAQSK